MRAAIFGLSLFLGCTWPAHAQPQASGLEVSDPTALGVGVAGVDEHARAVGITIDRLRNAVDATLQRHGIQKDRIAAEPVFLGVRVHVVAGGFVISLELHRWVSYQVDGIEHKTSAIVWRRERTGAHNGQWQTVVAAVTQLANEFLEEYLSANRDRL